MDFAQQQRNPAKHIVGIIFVILFHVLLVYALINGLAQRVVDVIKKPVEVKIVEEVKPPPPPEIKLPPPPKLTAPPPPFVPPPEVQIDTPPPVVQVTQVAPPPAAYVPQTTAPAAPPAPAAPAVANARVACPNARDVQENAVYPPLALKRGITEGSVSVRFVVKASGELSDIVVNAHPSIFAETATNMVRQLKCKPQAGDQPVNWEIGFKVE